jgi:hypothetical protein
MPVDAIVPSACQLRFHILLFRARETVQRSSLPPRLELWTEPFFFLTLLPMLPWLAIKAIEQPFILEFFQQARIDKIRGPLPSDSRF